MENDARPEKDATPLLTLTRRTIQHGTGAYPMRNISYFGAGTRPYGRVPSRLILIAFAAAFLFIFIGLLSRSPIAALGWLLLFAALGATAWNILGPERHGLVIVVNSGHTVFFETRDKQGITRVIDTIQEVSRRVDDDSETRVSFSDHSISISHSNVNGIVNAGNLAQEKGGNGVNQD